MRLRGRLLITAVAGVTALGTAGVARAEDGGGGGRQVIQAEDDCDPATFNAVIPGLCVGDGGTTFDEFLAQLRELKQAPDWTFDPSRTHAAPGTSLLVVNEGGETHTFTPVKSFGGGCVDLINGILDLPPSTQCDQIEATSVPPGGTLPVNGLTPGTHLFQCLIHPWMHAVVTVRAGGGHEGHGG